MEERQYLNGTLWQAPSKTIAVLQHLERDVFILLAVQPQALHGGSCLCIISDIDGKRYYREHELPTRLKAWAPLPDEMLAVQDRRVDISGKLLGQAGTVRPLDGQTPSQSPSTAEIASNTFL